MSGGSIVAAHLAATARPWPSPGDTIPGWEDQVSAGLLRFTRHNIRTKPILSRLLPWNWFKTDHAVNRLALTYERKLTGLGLRDLEGRPRFILNATDMSFGVNWEFDSGTSGQADGQAGDYQAGYFRPLPEWPLARAVAASSCFPPVFNPMRLHLEAADLTGGKYDKKDRPVLIEQLSLSDGGVYDNLGMEPVWKDHAVVLVSDGGAVFEAEQDAGLFWRMQRYVAIAGQQGAAMRKRWLISNFISGSLDGTYWGIGSAPVNYGYPGPGYSKDLIDEAISEVRTDLDFFSTAEQAVLINHGYLIADAAVSRHASELIAHNEPAEVPQPEWMDEDRVRRALADSHRRKLLGRFK